MTPRIAVIIGAGPAGLTAAYELLTRTDILPVVIERDSLLGGISRTVNYKGNRIDLGGHRFFSKSQRVMDWWLARMPRENGARAETDDLVMLLRRRKSRIYFDRKFFDYPIHLSAATVGKLGLLRSTHIAASYLHSAARPIRPERTLEDFLVNRFGRQLYRMFFQSYTQKVWGVPCEQISAEWGAQRIRGLSIARAIRHALGRPSGGSGDDLSQKDTETTLIEQFLYPKFGPGQMWEEVARIVREKGGRIVTGQEVDRVFSDGRRLTAIEALDRASGQRVRYEGNIFFSTMPIRELIRAMGTTVGDDVRQISEGLVYRDFITVGLLADELKIKDRSPQGPLPVKDNWIYIQEPDVRMGRLQIFNNWSPYMVADPSKTWVGLEYFCNAGEEIWTQSDRAMADLAAGELAKIGILDPAAVRDSTVLRMPQTYPAYFGTYDRFGDLRRRMDEFENLFLVGRNGMHKYNNQDHSMLTAMTAVDNLLSGQTSKDNLWAVNTEQEYHEGT